MLFPHIYCGSSLPYDYISQSNKIRIKFKSNDLKNTTNFNFTIKILNDCERNYTALQGRLLWKMKKPRICKTTIKVPENFTISLVFQSMTNYYANCDDNFMKFYDGSFETGNLVYTFCNVELPNPIFSTTNQLSIYSQQKKVLENEFDMFYIATDKGRGCGGEMFNFEGIFTSPFYPMNNRSYLDCTWNVRVPSNLRVALKFQGELKWFLKVNGIFAVFLLRTFFKPLSFKPFLRVAKHQN